MSQSAFFFVSEMMQLHTVTCSYCCVYVIQERSLKQQLQDEMAKAVVSNGTSLSISEYDALVSKIKSEAAKAHTELLEAKGTIPKRML
jgi:hypothetical protein